MRIAKRERRRGIAVLLTAAMLVGVMSIVGLAIDVGMMYAVKTKLSAAVDAAALGGAGAIGRGGSGGANATDTAMAYFNANMPAGYMFATNITATPTLTNSAAHVQTMTVEAQATLPLMFLHLLNSSADIKASGAASRRDINLVMVLDRSGSMSGAPCSQMIAAAQDFTKQFVDGRDYLGLIVFGGSYKQAYPLSTDFKNGGTPINSVISSIGCGGNTGSAQAIWQAYQMLKTLNQPGALNAVVFFTDGQPNGLSADWPIAKQVTPVYPNSSGSTGSTTATPISPWFLGYSASGCSANPITGVIARGGEQQNGIYGTTTTSISYDAGTVSNSSGCNFASGQTNVHKDVAYIPDTDTYGNSTHGYWDLSANGSIRTIPAGPYVGKMMLDHYASGTCGSNECGLFDNNIDLASMNAAESAATRARTDATVPVTIFAIGLGGAGDAAPDAFLQHVANTQESDLHTTAQPTGKYVYVTGPGQLANAFQEVASFVLRLSL